MNEQIGYQPETTLHITGDIPTFCQEISDKVIASQVEPNIGFETHDLTTKGEVIIRRQITRNDLTPQNISSINQIVDQLDNMTQPLTGNTIQDGQTVKIIRDGKLFGVSKVLQNGVYRIRFSDANDQQVYCVVHSNLITPFEKKAEPKIPETNFVTEIIPQNRENEDGGYDPIRQAVISIARTFVQFDTGIDPRNKKRLFIQEFVPGDQVKLIDAKRFGVLNKIPFKTNSKENAEPFGIKAYNQIVAELKKKAFKVGYEYGFPKCNNNEFVPSNILFVPAIKGVKVPPAELSYAAEFPGTKTRGWFVLIDIPAFQR